MPSTMKHIITLFLLFTQVCGIIAGPDATGKDTCTVQRKKVALVLSGGGAKGITHIGVLKVLEEMGIPIDYIVGTSMGSIVGGLYSIGYDARMLDSLVLQQDWMSLLTDRMERPALSFPEKEKADKYLLTIPIGKDKKKLLPAGLVKGQNIYSLFCDLTVGYHQHQDFTRFPIPFACIATDIVSGKAVVLDKGSLPLAMRASMAIPGVFTPIRLDSMLLIDGGIVNNFPCDVAKAMGADIIIGVNVLGDRRTIDRLNTASDIIGQIIDTYSMNGLEENKKMLDLYIRPEINEYNAASFSPADIDTFLVRGERAARDKWDDLAAIKKKIGIGHDTLIATAARYIPHDSLYIHAIEFEGVPKKDRKWLLKKSGLAENNRIAMKDLQKAIAILYGTKAYSGITYELTNGPEYDLHLKVTPLPLSSLNFGVRFDTEEVAALLLNLTLNLNTKYNSTLAFSGRASQNPFVRLDYSIDNSFFKRLNIGYMFNYNDVDLYTRGDKTSNVTFRRHTLEAGITDIYWQNFKFQLGLRYEHFNFNTILAASGTTQIAIHPEGFLSYFGQAKLETLDNRYFPTKGVHIQADYSLYTDNLTTYKGHAPFSALSMNFLTAIRCTPRFHILPSVYGRTLIGHTVAYPYLNVAGGNVFGKYFPQQVPFMGINHAEIVSKSVVAAKVQFRYRIGNNHYVSTYGNMASHDNDFFNLLKGNYLWGTGIGYAYNSMFGPVEAILSYSNHTDKMGFYLNLGYTF